MHCESGPHVPTHESAAPHSFFRSTPIGSGVHFPGLVSKAHEWQRSVHGESQHTPSTQFPLAHSLPLVQRWNPAATVGVAPQFGAGASATASVGGAPSVEASAPASEHPGTLVHTPTEPGTLHDEHASEHAVVQHTPPSQKPVAHASGEEQGSPCFFRFAHAPASQNMPETQSAAVAQEVLHPVAPHAYGAQSIGRGVGSHAPLPSQKAAPVDVPPTQVAAVHTVDVDG